VIRRQRLPALGRDFSFRNYGRRQIELFRAESKTSDRRSFAIPTLGFHNSLYIAASQEGIVNTLTVPLLRALFQGTLQRSIPFSLPCIYGGSDIMASLRSTAPARLSRGGDLPALASLLDQYLSFFVPSTTWDPLSLSRFARHYTRERSSLSLKPPRSFAILPGTHREMILSRPSTIVVFLISLSTVRVPTGQKVELSCRP